MDTIEQTDFGNTKKRGLGVKVVYGIAMALLTGLLLVSLYLYGQEWLNRQSVQHSTTQAGTLQSSTGSTQKPTSPIETTQESGMQPTQPSEEVTEPSLTPTENPGQVTEPGVPDEPEKVDIRLPAHTNAVCLIGKAAKAYLEAENVPSVSDFLAPYHRKGVRLDVGLPVELSYTVHSLPKGITVTATVFQLAETEDFAQSREFVPKNGERSVQIYHLMTGKRYYYRVHLTLSDGTVQTLKSSFKTAATPRLLNIDGIVNVRDIGGWVTASGKTVKQGLLYRGSELDGSVESGFTLTEKGKTQILDLLKIKTDMDLRHAGRDMLGPDVQHIYYSAIQYEHVFTPAGSDAVRRVFADLANPDNYPIYMHCTYGADRTGTMCYLLEALLGVSDQDLIRDYEMTALYYRYVSSELMDGFIQRIATYPGDTTQERVENFLLSVGVTPQEIASIRQIYLG